MEISTCNVFLDLTPVTDTVIPPPSKLLSLLRKATPKWLSFFFNIFIYLFAVSSLSCIMQDLLLGHTESLVVMLGLSSCGAQALEQVGGLRSCGAWA